MVNIIKTRTIIVKLLLAVLLSLTVCLSLLVGVTYASNTPNPSSVNIAGSLQDELGCPGDWQPDCATTHLTYDTEDGVWQGIFSIPAGNWEYKAALNDSWDENYGLNSQENGLNIPLNLADLTDVKFYYDHETHWITDSVNSIIATAPGSYQNEMGNSGDWDPGYLGSWLQDPDGDGVYTFRTKLPAGSYEAKVAINESWGENYGAGGVQNGPNIPFTVPSNCTEMLFSYDPVTHVLSVEQFAPEENPPVEPPIEVGGHIYSIDKYIILVPLIIAAALVATGTGILVKRRRAQN